MEEMRRFERKKMIDISFVQKNQVKGEVLDLSPSGAKLKFENTWKEGQEVSFSIRFPDWTHFPDIEIEGVVIWVKDQEVGVEFSNFDTLDLDTMNDYYRLLAEQKAKAETHN